MIFLIKNIYVQQIFKKLGVPWHPRPQKDPPPITSASHLVGDQNSCYPSYNSYMLSAPHRLRPRQITSHYNSFKNMFKITLLQDQEQSHHCEEYVSFLALTVEQMPLITGICITFQLRAQHTAYVGIRRYLKLSSSIQKQSSQKTRPCM